MEFTRLCLASVLRHSRSPYELILVDMASLDGTAEYLAGLSDAGPVAIDVLHTASDAGVAAAYNAAIAQTRGEYVVLLTNDTIVTAHWLEHLVALADSSATIGVVGAMSNRAAAPQSVGAVPYRLSTTAISPNSPHGEDGWPAIDTEPVHRFAQQWATENRGQWFEADRLSPFCLLFKRQVLNRVLPLEPDSFFTFNADWVFRKVRESGFQIACCRDLFVHHFASRPLLSHSGNKSDRP